MGKAMSLYAHICGKERYAILDAHGGDEGFWSYYVGPKNTTRHVQRWIRRNEQNYAGLFLFVCNPGCYEPKASHASVLFADGVLEFNGYGKLLTDDDRRFSLSLFVPVLGCLESYTVDWGIKELEEQIAKKN